MRSLAPRPSQRLARWHLTLPLLLLLALFTGTSALERVNLWFYDALIRQAPLAPPQELLIVAIDEQSLSELGRWPWARRNHGAVIDRLNEAGARTVALDILFTDPSPSQADDQMLASAMERHGNVILPLHIYPASDGEPLREFLPVASLSRAAARLAHVHVELDEDGLARGYYRREGLGEALWPSLADATALNSGHSLTDMDQDSRSLAPSFVNVRDKRVRIPFARRGDIPQVSYVDVLEGRVPDAVLEDRVVFVGATAAGFGDLLPTPVSGRNQPLSGVEFHANAYSAVVQDHLIHPARTWPAVTFGLALIALIAWQFPKRRPTQTFVLASFATALPVALSWLALRTTGTWLPPAAPALTAALAFPLWSTQRLALLNRFLNQQLDALGKEERISIGRLEDRPAVQILDHLQELLRPSNSWLATDNRHIRGQPPRHSGQDQPDLQPGKWRHEAARSWIIFHRNGHWHELGLVWPRAGANRETLNFLDSLHLHTGIAAAEIPRSRERVSRRIEQVGEATQALADMRRFIGAGFDRMPDGVLVTDALGVIRFVNPHIAQWFDQPRDSLIGMPLIRLLKHGGLDESSHTDGDWHTAILSTLHQGRQQSIGYQVPGRALLLHLAPFTLPDQRDQGLIANFSDITELRERQRQYREAIDFISHDMRSPLVSQLALLDQLSRAESPASKEDLSQIARLARRSYQLAEEFVQLARAEQLTPKRFYECELLTIAENAVDAVQEQAAARQIQIELEGEEELWLLGNAELLERAVINLLTNAIQYSPSGSEVDVQVQRTSTMVILSVSDQGPGIDWQEQPHVFDRFRRQRDSELKGQNGAGLGLSFVKTVADKHRGMVDLTSTPGRGSTFRLYLPALPA